VILCITEIISKKDEGLIMAEGNPTIFIVDDDESILKALKRLIKAVGFKVEAFSSAHEFLDYGYGERAGVLILDIRMPEMSGFELQKRLVESGSKLPVIFITAHGNEETCRLAMESGAVAFLQKPFEEQALLDAIGSGLRENPSECKKKGARYNQ
jgi:two-component system response regulator FixJ